ncbi:hypothetical protein STEG23_027796 [Scotinomys teguina]
MLLLLWLKSSKPASEHSGFAICIQVIYQAGPYTELLACGPYLQSDLVPVLVLQLLLKVLMLERFNRKMPRILSDNAVTQRFVDGFFKHPYGRVKSPGATLPSFHKGVTWPQPCSPTDIFSHADLSQSPSLNEYWYALAHRNQNTNKTQEGGGNVIHHKSEDSQSANDKMTRVPDCAIDLAMGRHIPEHVNYEVEVNEAVIDGNSIHFATIEDISGNLAVCELK